MATHLDSKSKPIVPFVENDSIDPDMDTKFRDLAFYHILLDARMGEEEFFLSGKNIFRLNQRHPPIDELDANKKLIIQLISDRI